MIEVKGMCLYRKHESDVRSGICEGGGCVLRDFWKHLKSRNPIGAGLAPKVLRKPQLAWE